MTYSCKICKSNITKLFDAKVLHKHSISYFNCGKCGFIQTEKPYWLEEAYGNAIASLDIGLVSRNIYYSGIVEIMLIKHWDYGKHFIDFGGGYGLFVRLMRDKGFDFYRQDIYCENLFARHFDVTDHEFNEKFEALTAFEVFEHLENPANELKYMFDLADSLIFSTELIPGIKINKAEDWWYFAPETGQHISFFTQKSLEILAEQFDCVLYSDKRSLHVLSKNKSLNNPFEAKVKNSFFKRLMLAIFQRLQRKKKKSQKKLTGRLESDYIYVKNKLDI